MPRSIWTNRAVASGITSRVIEYSQSKEEAMGANSVDGGNSVGGGAPDLKEIHDFLIDLAYKAGEIISSALPLNNSVDSKKNSQSELIPWSQRSSLSGDKLMAL